MKKAIKENVNETAGGKKHVIRRILCILGILILIALASALLYHPVRNLLQRAKAPKKSYGREYISEISVKGQDGELMTVGLSLDEVPDAYTYEPFHHGKLERFSYTTQNYGRLDQEEGEIEKEAMVYLPYGYSSDKQYNVVYLMHGAGGTIGRFFGWPSFPKEFKYIVDNMIATGEIEPMIFVSLTYYPENGMDRQRDWDANFTKAYVQELRNDVLPQVESHYSTYAETADPEGLKASRWHRTFAGFSMGSVTMFYRLCDCLDLFHSFMGMSGSLYWGVDARQNSDSKDFGAEYVIDAVEAQGYTKDDFFLYTCVGSEDFARDVMERQTAAEKNHPEFFSFGEDGEPANTVYELYEGERHGGGHGSMRYLYNALPIFSRLMAE